MAEIGNKMITAVIPAKAGQKSPGAILNSRRLAPKGRNTGMYSVIQALNGSRALRARLKNIIAVPAPRAGFFSLHEQRKETRRGSAIHKYASPQATQNLRRD